MKKSVLNMYLWCRFLVEEDEEALKKELKDAFRFYDKVENKCSGSGSCSRSVANGDSAP